MSTRTKGGITLSEQERAAIAAALPPRSEGGVAAVAKRSGVHRVHIHGIVAGRIRPQEETLARLLSDLGLVRRVRRKRLVVDVGEIVPAGHAGKKN